MNPVVNNTVVIKSLFISHPNPQALVDVVSTRVQLARGPRTVRNSTKVSIVPRLAKTRDSKHEIAGGPQECVPQSAVEGRVCRLSL